jgi:hypothetical protein
VTHAGLHRIFDELGREVSRRGWSRREWARQAGIWPETLCRLPLRGNCDLATIQALAHAVGLEIAIAQRAGTEAQRPIATPTPSRSGMPSPFGREDEQRLLALCAARMLNTARWAKAGPAFFMGGLAVMLAGLRDLDRARLLRLGERLYPGIASPQVFRKWLRQSPLRPSRFVPMLRARLSHAA